VAIEVHWSCATGEVAGSASPTTQPTQEKTHGNEHDPH
jgi:hypothetical protein